MKTWAILLSFILVISFVTANMERIAKLENTLEKRFRDVQNSPYMASEYGRFLEMFNKARMDRLKLEKEGNYQRSETHYMSDILGILVEIYKLEDKVTPAGSM